MTDARVDFLSFSFLFSFHLTSTSSLLSVLDNKNPSKLRYKTKTTHDPITLLPTPHLSFRTPCFPASRRGHCWFLVAPALRESIFFSLLCCVEYSLLHCRRPGIHIYRIVPQITLVSNQRSFMHIVMAIL